MSSLLFIKFGENLEKPVITIFFQHVLSGKLEVSIVDVRNFGANTRKSNKLVVNVFNHKKGLKAQLRQALGEEKMYHNHKLS